MSVCKYKRRSHSVAYAWKRKRRYHSVGIGSLCLQPGDVIRPEPEEDLIAWHHAGVQVQEKIS